MIMYSGSIPGSPVSVGESSSGKTHDISFKPALNADGKAKSLHPRPLGTRLGVGGLTKFLIMHLTSLSFARFKKGKTRLGTNRKMKSLGSDT